MTLRSRLPVLLLACVALGLTSVIGVRISADANPTPGQTRPIVISSPSPAADSTTTPRGSSDDDFTRVYLEPHDVNDDGHQRGKGSSGGGGSRGSSGSGGSSGSDDGGGDD